MRHFRIPLSRCYRRSRRDSIQNPPLSQILIRSLLGGDGIGEDDEDEIEDEFEEEEDIDETHEKNSVSRFVGGTLALIIGRCLKCYSPFLGG